MRCNIFWLLSWLTVVCIGPASAASLVDVDVISRSTGQAIARYFHQGNTYVSGDPGERYAVRMVNRTGARVLVVLSVDGVNAVSGETATPEQSGYVLAPYASAEIDGWRKNMREVAQFYFTSLADSYAARTDRPGNVGVIGVAAFRERARPEPGPMLNDQKSRSQPAPAPSADAQKRESGRAAEAPAGAPYPPERERLGTGHGERQYAPTEYTRFERARRSPDEVVAIRYDSYANLLARGIIAPSSREREPQPFPGRFVPDPKW
jgi:hypothetical protein